MENKQINDRQVAVIDDLIYQTTYAKALNVLEALQEMTPERKSAVKSLINDAFYGAHYHDLVTYMRYPAWDYVQKNWYRANNINDLMTASDKADNIDDCTTQLVNAIEKLLDYTYENRVERTSSDNEEKLQLLVTDEDKLTITIKK